MRIVLLALCCVLLPAAEWPRRPLMEAREENSMMHRYLAKPVQESLLLDDMETDRGWAFSGIGALTYTTDRAVDGKRSLRLQTLMRDEETLKANRKNGTFVGDQGGFTVARLDFGKPQDWSRYNRISLWVYIHPSSMRTVAFRLRVEWEGFANRSLVPNPSHFVQDLEPGKWHHVVWEIPDLPRERITTFMIRQVHTGHNQEHQGTVTYDFDRLELERVDAEPFEGWQVAPGRIAFHHVGYRPSEKKLAFAAATGEAGFELLEAASGRTAASFPAATVVNRRGRFAVLDFTGFTRPGRYLLRYGKAAGRPFQISDDFWFGTIEKAMNFYYCERCGFDVPGVHRICHQDWRGTHAGHTKFINGGWHDAGDLSQGSHRTAMSVYSMLRIYDQLRQRELRPDLQARMLEEARWGLDWLLKTRFGGGYRITWVLGRFYTDNRVGTVDDMLVPAEHVAFENFLFSAVAACAARELKDTDPRRAALSLAAAEEDFRATLAGRAAWTAVTRDEAALGALAAVELFRATRNPKYAAEAARFGRLLLQCQEQRFIEGLPLTGFFYSDTSRRQVSHDEHASFEETPQLAFEALCDAFPDHVAWMEWYAAAMLHSEYYFHRGAAISEPYRHLPGSVWPRREIEELTRVKPKGWDVEGAVQQFNDGTGLSADYRLRVFPIWHNQTFHGNTAIQMSGAAGLLSAALLRNRPEAEDLARLQLQWVFGGNPFSQSLMYGEGYDFQPQFAYCLRNLVGSLPVGVDSRHDDTPCWSATNTATYKEMWVVPVSRLLLGLAYQAMPARVSGTAAGAVTLREVKTGITASLPRGKFAINLAPGEYSVECGGLTRRVNLLAGGHYDLPLVDVALSSRKLTPSTVLVEAHVRGAGAHRLQLRAFNATVEAPEQSVTLGAARERTLHWTLKITNADQPWAAVAIADGNSSSRREVFGTTHELPALP